jgi:DNA-binding CsgD family transcriptional regulator
LHQAARREVYVTLNLRTLTVHELLDLRRRLDEQLLRHRGELERQLECLNVAAPLGKMGWSSGGSSSRALRPNSASPKYKRTNAEIPNFPGGKAALERLRGRFDHLTAREREIMAFVAAGFKNKRTAGVLGVSEITVKVHRSNLMRKMRAGSLPELVRMADALNVRPASGRR